MWWLIGAGLILLGISFAVAVTIGRAIQLANEKEGTR